MIILNVHVFLKNSMRKTTNIYDSMFKIKDLIVNVKASNKSKVVCLVEEKWYKNLVNWLNKKTDTLPSKLDNSVLMHDKTLRNDIQYKKDFEIVEEAAWDKIVENFGAKPKISRYLLTNPENQIPCISFEHARLHINVNNNIIRKTVDVNWTFGPIIKLLCDKFELNPDEYKLYIPDGTRSVRNSTLIRKVVEKYPGTLILKKHGSIATAINKVIEADEPEKQLVSPRRIIKADTKIMVSPTKTRFAAPTIMYPKPVGFRNLGNTCFFNAAMQCLLRVQKLTDFIVSDKFEAQINTENPAGSKGDIARSYRKFLIELCNGSTFVPRNPSDLRRAIVTKYQRFANYSQHDSQELLGAVLDGLHEDLNQARAAKGSLPPSPTKKSDDSWKIHIAKNSSPIMNLFHGELISSITCPICKHADSVHDPFLFLSVPIAKKYIVSLSLEDCINEFAEKDVLDKDNMWKCPCCHKPVQATKTLNVYRCAPILIIHFKRFSPYSQRKISTKVDYPDVLDTSNFVVSEEGGKYRLIGAVFHHGGLFGGHYTSAALSQDTNKWYYYDDSVAREISSKEAHSSSAYILFYQLIE